MAKQEYASTFLQLVKSPFRFKMFLLKRLPMAFLAGLRIAKAEPETAAVTVSLSYLTKNPFRSIYFACLAMAAELSTGILAMNAIEQAARPFSLLVVGMEAEFTKKATGTITFESDDGDTIIRTVQQCLAENKAGTCTATSTGTNQKGIIVAKFSITWSFKPKQK